MMVGDSVVGCLETFHSQQMSEHPSLAAPLPMCLNGPLFSDPP